jgi:hypothetical protein
MTVKELMKLLENYDPDMVVGVMEYDQYGDSDAVPASEFEEHDSTKCGFDEIKGKFLLLV